MNLADESISAEKSIDGCVILYCTASSRGEALSISRAIIAEKLAACCNILGSITSIYEWQGEVCDGEEISFIIKTSEKKSTAAIERISQLHSYECPCIISISVDGGYGPFLSWISKSLAE
jgi:periplasmic divalent cation tolerance protein